MSVTILTLGHWLIITNLILPSEYYRPSANCLHVLPTFRLVTGPFNRYLVLPNILNNASTSYPFHHITQLSPTPVEYICASCWLCFSCLAHTKQQTAHTWHYWDNILYIGKLDLEDRRRDRRTVTTGVRTRDPYGWTANALLIWPVYEMTTVSHY